MIRISEEQGIMRVAFSGDMNRNNILSIRDTILGSIHPEICGIAFHFDDVRQMDAPAMAIVVIVVKYLRDRMISSKVTGLTGESMDLASLLGLHHIAEVEGKIKERRGQL